ncbi:hypothetical protein HK100_009429 [Physocladia obscura]|uniref:GPI transamidase component PIG-S n=1 Tax=Physocladia obscura TaxID=109957 RepID=A0AAD5T391_9FUNG|nr:hypothetical protein HK100_009429 [Physocladia obscura]
METNTENSRQVSSIIAHFTGSTAALVRLASEKDDVVLVCCYSPVTVLASSAFTIESSGHGHHTNANATATALAIEYASPSTARVIRCIPAALATKRLSSILHPDDIAMVDNTCRKKLAAPTRLYCRLMRMDRASEFVLVDLNIEWILDFMYVMLSARIYCPSQVDIIQSLRIENLQLKDAISSANCFVPAQFSSVSALPTTKLNSNAVIFESNMSPTRSDSLDKSHLNESDDQLCAFFNSSELQDELNLSGMPSLAFHESGELLDFFPAFSPDQQDHQFLPLNSNPLALEQISRSNHLDSSIIHSPKVLESFGSKKSKTVQCLWIGAFERANETKKERGRRESVNIFEEMNSSENSLKVKQQTIGWLIILIILFVPVWWKTTQVHRAVLPMSRVRSLRTREAAIFSIAITVDISNSDELGNVAQQSVVATSVHNQLNILFKNASTVTPTFSFAVYAKQSVLEQETPTENGRYNVNVQCGFKSLRSEGSVSIYEHRLIEIITGAPCSESELISSQIVTVIGGLFLNERKDFAAVGNHEDKRKVKFSPEYQLMFNLLNADPIEFLVDWEINDAIQENFQPFVDAVAKLYDIKIKTKIQYFTTLNILPDKVSKNGTINYILKPHQLPHFINSADWSFGGSAVSISPPINFVVYVPSHTQSPLYISSSNDKGSPLVETNGFLIPQWGGIVITNPNVPKSNMTKLENGVSIYRISKFEMQPAMQVFIAQMRSLLGIRPVELGSFETLLPGFDFNYEYSTVGVTKWELDRLTRFTTFKNVQDSVSTLNSLITLIESMENMVVLDHIKDEITISLDSISKVYEIVSAKSVNTASSHEHNLALAASRTAIISAERAFFDPTMVSLLYFPDEHKLAVYLPLFLPVGVPLLSTIGQEIRKYIKKRKENKIKTE